MISIGVFNVFFFFFNGIVDGLAMKFDGSSLISQVFFEWGNRFVDQNLELWGELCVEVFFFSIFWLIWADLRADLAKTKW